ncbi:hypothetical protein CTAM01_16925 [Colletotrichum tamarilloi]|uniref:Uncharacterized protein n=1 Tax=Colletotrichum tamarilloi TaxID=1209934 RepID=A0ABQ9QH51_9PEZI|nr:uncharacterized protein CTAM01_16925 [Colletotrichum tamarilloi]KAK1468219.1 hypothetical protein CTAM01_16925 [Colletotrichum tamarilloi]
MSPETLHSFDVTFRHAPVSKSPSRQFQHHVINSNRPLSHQSSVEARPASHAAFRNEKRQTRRPTETTRAEVTLDTCSIIDVDERAECEDSSEASQPVKTNENKNKVYKRSEIRQRMHVEDVSQSVDTIPDTTAYMIQYGAEPYTPIAAVFQIKFLLRDRLTIKAVDSRVERLVCYSMGRVSSICQVSIRVSGFEMRALRAIAARYAVLYWLQQTTTTSSIPSTIAVVSWIEEDPVPAA